MKAQIMDGKKIAASIRTKIKNQITKITKKGMRPPALSTILLGNDAASHIYIKNKILACEEVGIQSHSFLLPKNTTQKKLLKLIHELNHRSDIDGILVQLPLPSSIQSQCIIESIDPKKDVDGFHPYNLGRLAQFHPLFRPCTPYGVMELLQALPIDLPGKHAVVIGDSNIVGKPMMLELLMKRCTVTLCHRATKNLKNIVKEADILVSAIGKRGIIQSAWISKNTVVIDVGINRIKNKVYGDIDFQNAQKRASWITPVPGGVGPMTVAMLLKNTLVAFQKKYTRG
ncbi:MAG: bifunctional methylenetetrahydrofolate dehydrogenase/methenyltetrahydrofolate cyclohydrolase [Gammaproteobacteria bacterium RIFCSPLOWO2_02_FULL_38_11]|nr:MAG: bifunctional methylenetetrahydrofolate dehydrogenase/methenyltetrahydrofolate cyclohydrolase [Gammaproteobacteria bacterium RIFCSPHIGHO2_02_FULL_38_33]OGT24509.1 MAG: bifunctional methylenetetrahydrofolate dehydrogenase/methenyltetrahydrofolate cyclohydrolase [Gammaproteobacteria bacterium RIFCSPHIGHO2_12_38_15]OGT68988.1 MAG: bifunctional methylenetetrahydrofolate dehydrogenase/methenyltetrahydrofolate cyclohydrolase [Gammaproteobacteria bacterium RIFCSPLOWO2_02_FULL_38_11]OGT75582.1 MA